MEIFEIIGRILGAIVVAIIAYLTPRVKAWMNVHMNKTMVDNVVTLIDSFVRAADQLYHDDDPTGEKRNAYVKKQLMLAGVEISDTVVNLIEGAVFNVNIERKGVSVPVVSNFAEISAPDTSAVQAEVAAVVEEVKSEEKKATTKKATKSKKVDA